MASKERIFSGQGQGSDLIFDRVGVQLEAAVVQEQGQAVPVVQKVGDRLAHLAARRQARSLLAQESLEFGDERP